MSDKNYQAEAIRVHQKMMDLHRRRVSARRAEAVRLPDFFTIEGRIRCKPATLIQALAEDLGGDIDNLSPGVRIVVEKKLERILRRYNVRPSWIPLIERVMDSKKIANWK